MSWGHALRFAVVEEKYSVFLGHTYTHDYRTDACSLPHCPSPVEFVGTYSYVTGSRGRTSYAERPMCRIHAQRFAVRHDVRLPPEPVMSDEDVEIANSHVAQLHQ